MLDCEKGSARACQYTTLFCSPPQEAKRSQELIGEAEGKHELPHPALHGLGSKHCTCGRPMLRQLSGFKVEGFRVQALNPKADCKP